MIRTAKRGENVTRPIAGDEYTREEIDQAVREGRLLSAELEMTNACNLRCVYCYSDAGEVNTEELTHAQIVDATVQAHDLGARKIVLLGGGEPCVYPRLDDLIAGIRRLGCSVELFTNGTLIDADLAGFLYANGVSVVVKRNSASAKVQNALAGTPGTFERIQRGIGFLQAAGYPDAEHGLGVQTVLCRQNLPEIPDLWRWARSRGIQPYFETLTHQGRCAQHPDISISVAEAGEAFRLLSRIDKQEFGIDWSPSPPLAGACCSRHLYSILIKADGEIWPCVGVAISAGNIRRHRLEDVLRTHPVIQDLRHIHERIEGPCRTCDRNGTCYGCRGNAFQITGRYLASDPLCWVCQSEPLTRGAAIE